MRLDSSWNVMEQGDARVGKWRGNWRMEWVASTLHSTSEHGVSSITTADTHTSAASSRLNWRPHTPIPAPILLHLSVSPKDKSRDGSVGIATPYGLDGSGIESR